VVEGGGDSGGVFLPSLLSPLFLFSAPLSSVFPLSSLLLLCLFVAVSGGWWWQCQRRSGGVLWRLRRSTVAAAVVLLLWYIFFLCHSPFSPLPPLMASLSLSKKTVSSLGLPHSLFFLKKSFQLSFFSLKNVPPSVILLSGRSLLSPPQKNCCFSFGFSSLPPCFVSVSPLLLLVAAAVDDAAGDKAKWRWRSFQRWRERERERWVTVLLPYSFVFLFVPSILSSAQVFPSLFVYPVFKTISVPLSNNPCSLLYSVLILPFSPLDVLPPLVFIAKRRESPHCLVPSCMAQEGNRVTLPLQGKVADCLQGRGCVNGGRVWDELCFFWQVRAEREGNSGFAGEHTSLFFPCLLRVQGAEGFWCHSKRHRLLF